MAAVIVAEQRLWRHAEEYPLASPALDTESFSILRLERVETDRVVEQKGGP